MKIPVGMFNKGAVIYVDYTFDDDRTKHKRRPAVVIDFDDNSTEIRYTREGDSNRKPSPSIVFMGLIYKRTNNRNKIKIY